LASELTDSALRVLVAARSEATRCGRTAVGGEYVLAELAEHPDLHFRRLSNSHHAIRIACTNEGRSARVEEPPFNGEVRVAIGLGLRFAVLFRSDYTDLEHVLLGLLWHPWSVAAQVARKVDLAFRDALQELFGYESLPAHLAPPRVRPLPDGDRVTVPYEHLDRLLERLPNLLPPGAPLAFNHDYEHAWFRSMSGVDLTAAVRRALQSS